MDQFEGNDASARVEKFMAVYDKCLKTKDSATDARGEHWQTYRDVVATIIPPDLRQFLVS